MAKKAKIVLYEPQMVDQRTGEVGSYDLLPLEMLHIAAIPDKEGYEVVILDANLYSHEEAHRRAIDECKDAIIFATTQILGFMVADGHECATKVRAAYPKINIIAGGWFPSCLPDMYLQSGVYDAVALGQGELTFRDYVHAVESGANLETVEGLAVWRDNQVVKTAPRKIIGWDDLPNAAWHLIDIEPYRERQMRPGAHKAVVHMVAPPDILKSGRRNYFGISYYASYGCPEPCIFCCSPEVTNQRWKAMPADRMLDDLQDLQQRWGFEAVRFHDANWGVHEKRVREFCQGVLDREMKFGWSTTIEVFTTLRYQKSTLDLLRDSGLYVVHVGAEAADPEMIKRIGKPINPGDTKACAAEYHNRDIITSLTYIIGYPGETTQSMLATLDQARDIVGTYPSVSAQVFPFRPIPGNVLFREAIDMGYVPPGNLAEWGKMLRYHVMHTWKGNIPSHVERIWRLYYQYASFFHGLVRPKRGLLERIAGWRLRSGNYRFPIELKTFYALDRIMGGRSRREDEKQTWIQNAEEFTDASPTPKVAMPTAPK